MSSDELRGPECLGAALRRPACDAARRWVARPELALFLAAYLLYDAGRWLFAGHAPEARAHADWIIDLERSAHVAVEGPFQRALEGPVVS